MGYYKELHFMKNNNCDIIRSIWIVKKSAISKSNSLNYKYIDEVKQIDNKEGKIDE